MEIKLPTKEERIALHKRGVKMILVTVLLGVLAGILSSPYFLSQPLYAPITQNGGEDFTGYSSFKLNHAAVWTPSATAPAGSFVIPDGSLLLGNSSVLYSNTSALPNAAVRYTNAIIQAGHASVSHVNSSVLLTNAQVELTDSTAVPANASVLLNNGVILLSNPADTQNATVLLGSDTSMQTNPHAPNNTNFAFLILALLIYVQKYIFPYLGIDSKRFGFKDWFFLSFMTFCFWFVTWTLLLNGPAPFFGPLF
jgi:hypothetical protein